MAESGMSENKDVYDFSNIPEDVAEEVLRQAEGALAGTLQFAFAADQRATAMAGIFGAGFVALLVAAAAVWTEAQPNLALFWGCLTTATGLFMASFTCAWAARPDDFYMGGYEPKRLIKAGGGLVWMQRYIAEEAQRCIDFNRQCLRRAARIVTWGAIIAFLSPFLGALAFLLAG